jgi:hypothetical protein
MLLKIFQRVVSLLRSYLKNIFDGKITTLVGAFFIGLGIHKGLSPEGSYMEVSAYVALGLVMMGFKDPRFNLKDKDEDKTEP